MLAEQAFRSLLQIQIECGPDNTIWQRTFSRQQGVYIMRREAGRIEPLHVRHRRAEKVRLISGDDLQLGKPANGPRITPVCVNRMRPGIESAGRLRQSTEENGFSQSKLASGLT